MFPFIDLKRFFGASLCFALLSNVQADDTNRRPRLKTGSSDVQPRDSLEIGCGALFSNVRSSKLDGYTLIPLSLSWNAALTEVGGEGFVRGNLEFIGRVGGQAIAHGVESRIVGFDVGARYNFVQPGWKLVPFLEHTAGMAFADSQGRRENGHDVGLGQDFNFQLTVATGIRYDLSEDWYVRLALQYAHYSNAGLSTPDRDNRAIDALGPILSFGRWF